MDRAVLFYRFFAIIPCVCLVQTPTQSVGYNFSTYRGVVPIKLKDSVSTYQWKDYYDRKVLTVCDGTVDYLYTEKIVQIYQPPPKIWDLLTS